MPKRVQVKSVDEAVRMVNSTIRSARQRMGASAVAVEVPQSFDDLSRHLQDDDEEIVKAKLEAINLLIDFAFQDGPDPSMVLLNFFVTVHGVRPEALLNMSGQEIGNLLDRTKAAYYWRMEKIFSRSLKKAGAKGFRARCQKSEESRANYSTAQLGNNNRRKAKTRRHAA